MVTVSRLIIAYYVFPGTCPLGVAFDFLSTEDEDNKLGPILFENGRKFNGKKQENGESLLRVAVRDYQLKETQYFQVRVTNADDSGDDDTVKIQWKLRSQETFSREFESVECTKLQPCELQNNGREKTGVYVYWETDDMENALDQDLIATGNRYEFDVQWLDNTVYRANDPNSAHQHVECSGRGICDRGNGRCTCFDSFTGEACQRSK